jgi:hypothetical protein
MEAFNRTQTRDKSMKGNPGCVRQRAFKDVASQVGDRYEVQLIDRACEQVR